MCEGVRGGEIHTGNFKSFMQFLGCLQIARTFRKLFRISQVVRDDSLSWSSARAELLGRWTSSLQVRVWRPLCGKGELDAFGLRAFSQF